MAITGLAGCGGESRSSASTGKPSRTLDVAGSATGSPGPSSTASSRDTPAQASPPTPTRAPWHAPAPVPAAVLRHAAGAVVKVRGTGCGRVNTGSGWAGGPHLILTAAHVVAGMHQITVTPQRGDRPDAPAAVVRFDAVNDVAVLRVPSLSLGALRMGARFDASSPTRSVASLGYPRGEEYAVTRGRIDTVLTSDRNHDIYGNRMLRDVDVLTGPVVPGDSGSAVVDRTGRVVSMIWGASVFKGRHYALGVPLAHIRAALAVAVRASSSIASTRCLTDNG